MKNVEARWVKSNKDGEYYKVGPDDMDYERWGLTMEDLVKEADTIIANEIEERRKKREAAIESATDEKTEGEPEASSA